MNLMIERLSIKLPTTIKIPTKPVTPSTPRDSGLDEMKKGVGNTSNVMQPARYDFSN